MRCWKPKEAMHGQVPANAIQVSTGDKPRCPAQTSGKLDACPAASLGQGGAAGAAAEKGHAAKRRRLNTPQQSTAPQSQPIRSRAEPLRTSTSTAAPLRPFLSNGTAVPMITPRSVSAAPAQKASVTGQALRVQLKQPQSSAGQVAPSPLSIPLQAAVAGPRQTHPVSFQGSCQYTASILARSQHCPAISGSW